MNRTIAELKSCIRDDFLFADFKDFPEITEKVKQENIKRLFTGGVRINQGMYRTKAETDDYIRRSLNRRLP